MIILTVRTDKPEAEIGLYRDEKKLAYQTWQAHRQLAETIHTKIEAMLKGQGLDWRDISGIVCYRGPGSFTGLRIGLTVSNTLAAELGVPIVGETGGQWIAEGIQGLLAGKDAKLVMPEYGRDPHITTPKR